MMSRSIYYWALLLSGFFLISCNTQRKLAEVPAYTLDTLSVSASAKPIYNPSRPRVNDVIHTKLEVKFDFAKKHLNGKAWIKCKPYFKPLNRFEFDAKGFDIHKTGIFTGAQVTEIKHVYDGKKLILLTEKLYTERDTVEFYIEYTAKPDELQAGGSAAIQSDKGLYFINPDGTEDKPQQIWTQGETEASSCWFPTVDAPNEKMSQEVSITVPNKFITLSNGTLEFQTDNGDGTRTDYWKQTLPHAPYLAMMAVGEYAVVQDIWQRGDGAELEVNYYVEQEYETHAKAIFGNTPEMMSFYSKILGYPYPWDKYAQIIVRDYVSGAMENTGAVIHGQFVQQTTRELLDGNNESIIAHELFHHWFGDLVTCESWANLPLNESFATYAEYLWEEHKYGRDAADFHLMEDWQSYLMESSRKQVDLIRYNYLDKEDMFDSHSYAKGGAILHMLRYAVGDTAFFRALNLYLTRNAFGTAEIHDLRLAFEQVTGEDMNWFFNQWFLNSGHPTLRIDYQYNAEKQHQLVIVEQRQDQATTPIYRLPVSIDFYTGSKVIRKDVVVENEVDTFIFEMAEKPKLVNFDSEKILLCKRFENKTNSEWIYQYYQAPRFHDRLEALRKCATLARKDSAAAQAIADGLGDKFWYIRQQTAKVLSDLPELKNEALKSKLIALAEKDTKSQVRAAAIQTLRQLYSGEDLLPQLRKASEDQSYMVIAESIVAISRISPSEALTLARSRQNEEDDYLAVMISGIFAEHGENKDAPYFLSAISNADSYNKIGIMQSYEDFLVRETRPVEVREDAADMMIEIGNGTDPFYVKFYAVKVLTSLSEQYNSSLNALEKEISRMEQSNPGSLQMTDLLTLREQETARKKRIDDSVAKITEKEKNFNLLRFIDNEE